MSFHEARSCSAGRLKSRLQDGSGRPFAPRDGRRLDGSGAHRACTVAARADGFDLPVSPGPVLRPHSIYRRERS